MQGGSLEDFGLVLIALLSADLEATLWLRSTRGDLSAEVALEANRLVWAAFGQERGLAALDALVLGHADVDFQLEHGSVLAPDDQNLSLTVDELRAHLASLGVPVQRLDAVPAPGVPMRRQSAAARRLPRALPGLSRVERSLVWPCLSRSAHSLSCSYRMSHVR